MATTISGIETQVKRLIRDTSNNSVTEADRFDAITEAVRQLHTEFGFDYTNKTYNLDYFDTLNYYNIATDISDFLEPVDLRSRDKEDNISTFTRKSPRELNREINSPEGDSYAIETKNQKQYLVISHNSKFAKTQLHQCDSLTANGTWQLGESSAANTSDSTNLTLDEVEFKQGTGALNFDIDATQDAANAAIISNEDMTAVDLTKHEDLSSLLAWVYIPDVTNFTSVTAYWGSSASAYWYAAVTTDAFGAAFVAGWNRIKVNWADTTKTGSPTVSATNYLRFDFNYGAGQGDDTDFRLDDIIMVRPEKLEFHYQTWDIGVVSTSDSTGVQDFTVGTNVPFYSGTYDYFDVYVAHRAAAKLFREVGLHDDADRHEVIAREEMEKLKDKFPTSQHKQTKSFKVGGLNW